MMNLTLILQRHHFINQLPIVMMRYNDSGSLKKGEVFCFFFFFFGFVYGSWKRILNIRGSVATGEWSKKPKDDIFNHNQEAERTGNETTLQLSSPVLWCVSSSHTLPSKISMPSRVTNWEVSFQINEYVLAISHSNHHTHEDQGFFEMSVR